MSGRIAGLLILLLLASLPQAVQAAPGWGAGLHRLSVTDPVDQQPMSVLVFYPSTRHHATTRIDLFQLQAGEDVPLAPGRFPLIVLSHGNSGTPLAHHDLASFLARRGFVVLAVQHPGDNVGDQSRLNHLSNLYGRPMQLSAAIDAAERDSWLASAVDTSQVGVIGYSAGGESALILAGAHPRLDHLLRYCREDPDDTEACTRAAGLAADAGRLTAITDYRVHALLLLAPLALMFGRDDLLDVHVPVLLYAGSADRLLKPEHNADALARGLPGPAFYRKVPGGGHFTFMAPCTPEMDQLAPSLCEENEGVDRIAIHQSLNVEAARFFSQTLNSQPAFVRWEPEQ
jgi:predicted dienelactone hydrolase